MMACMPASRRGSRRSIAELAPSLCAALTIALSAAAAIVSVMQARTAAQARREAEAHRPVEVRSQHYVSSNECRSCHPREHATWSASFHRTMTQLATPNTVRGGFDGVTLGRSPEYTLGRSEHGFYVDIAPGPDAPRQRHPVTLVTGSHHMQIYWYETGHDRSLGQLPFAYLQSDRRWVPRNAIFIEPPQALTPAAEGRWNASCIACHTTLGQPRIDASGKFDTEVAEFGIACEACHGPGEEHVARNRSPLARYGRHFGADFDEAIVQPKKLTHRRASYVCGQCHGTWLYDSPSSMREWNEHGTPFRPGADPPASIWLLQPSRAGVDPRIAEVVTRDRSYVDGQFWSDGVMRVSGREFNGMVDSPCYVHGELSCLSCHGMHQGSADSRPISAWRDDQLAPEMDTDRACLQCHGVYARSPERHTHHAPASQGSRCYNCHMPYTSYGLLKALRSHRIDVPSVSATLDAGRPNACNLCHLDKSVGWAAKQLETLYGIAPPAIEGDAASVPLALLLGLRGDAGQRALIAWALGWTPARTASRAAFAPALLGVLMDDPYDAVRYIAERSLRASGLDAPGYDFVQRPSEREPVAQSVARRAAPGLARDEGTPMHALFERLLRDRDTKPMRLLE
jgi:hypothetical protein